MVLLLFSIHLHFSVFFLSYFIHFSCLTCLFSLFCPISPFFLSIFCFVFFFLPSFSCAFSSFYVRNAYAVCPASYVFRPPDCPHDVLSELPKTAFTNHSPPGLMVSPFPFRPQCLIQIQISAYCTSVSFSQAELLRIPFPWPGIRLMLLPELFSGSFSAPARPPSTPSLLVCAFPPR